MNLNEKRPHSAKIGYVNDLNVAIAAWNRRALTWVAVAERLPEPEQAVFWWNAVSQCVRVDFSKHTRDFKRLAVPCG